MHLTAVPRMALTMSYQALLFCPDEKTARTVTQVLGELDFTVVPCTEPFGAVKKLMGERFDAVVVDCENEQNATLLFKSARSAPTNQGALAVAVVEGQAGVAKAFRIGANLVLTKPINVEQAKGTLRVARGLLRKNEGTKASAPTTATSKVSAPVSAAPKPAAGAASPRISESPAAAMPRVAVVPVPKPVAQPVIAASAAVDNSSDELDVSTISIEEPEAEAAEQAAPRPIEIAPAIHASPSTASAPPKFEARSSAGFAASAPAPARETKSSGSIDHKPSDTLSHIKSDLAEKEIEKAAASTHTLTFGGTVGAPAKPASSGSKKGLIAAVALVLIAVAGGYTAWTMKWNPLKSFLPASAPARATVHPAAPSVTPAPVQAVTPAPNPVTASPSSENQLSQRQAPEAQAQETSQPEISTPAPAKPAKVAVHKAAADAAADAKPAAAAPEESNLVATSASADAIVVKNDHPKPAAKPVETAEAPALNISASADSGGALSNLVAPSNTPAPVLQRLVVSQGVSRGLLIKQVPPSYPRTAIDMHIEGAVEIMATVSKTGDISEAKVISGDKQLARAAIDAVKQWKYKPYLLNGEPVDIQTQITVNFKLPQ
jgi:periplasmic protein TonB